MGLDNVDGDRIDVTVKRHVVEVADLVAAESVVRYSLGYEAGVVNPSSRWDGEGVVGTG